MPKTTMSHDCVPRREAACRSLKPCSSTKYEYCTCGRGGSVEGGGGGLGRWLADRAEAGGAE